LQLNASKISGFTILLLLDLLITALNQIHSIKQQALASSLVVLGLNKILYAQKDIIRLTIDKGIS
jgi:hypothetical protein